MWRFKNGGDVEIMFRQVRSTLPGRQFPFTAEERVAFGDRNTYKTATFNLSSKDGVGDINIIPYKGIPPFGRNDERQLIVILELFLAAQPPETTPSLLLLNDRHFERSEKSQSFQGHPVI